MRTLERRAITFAKTIVAATTAAALLVSSTAAAAQSRDEGQGWHHQADGGRTDNQHDGGRADNQHDGGGHDQQGGGHQWRRGQRIAHNDWNGAQRVDYRQHHLRHPPRGYEWREVNGQYLLGAVATGVILSTMLNNSH